MAKIRNTSGENLTLHPSYGGRLVLVGGVIDVKAGEVYGFTASANWEPVDGEATKAHDLAEADYAERLIKDGQAPPPAPTAAEPAEPAAKKSSKSNATPEV